MASAYIVEDDPFFAESLAGLFTDLGVQPSAFHSVKKIENCLSGPAPDFLLVDLAIPIEGSKLIGKLESRGGTWAGVALLRHARAVWNSTHFALLTGRPTDEARQWCEDNSVEYLIKPVSRSTLERLCRLRRARAFVVHGRDKDALVKLRGALESIGIDPIVLIDQPNKGRTVIEKFEEVSDSCDCAIVAMCHDDVGRLVSAPISSDQARVRQNVLFELGYFYAALGRRSGRVILVEFGETEIPSDLAGVVRINGLQDISALVTEMSRELSILATSRSKLPTSR